MLDWALDLNPIEKRVAALLMAYWSKNPLACDTQEGIQRWWLPLGDAYSLTDISGALAWLAERGLVEQSLATDGRIRFRCIGDANAAALQRFAADAAANVDNGAAEKN